MSARRQYASNHSYDVSSSWGSSSAHSRLLASLKNISTDSDPSGKWVDDDRTSVEIPEHAPAPTDLLGTYMARHKLAAQSVNNFRSMLDVDVNSVPANRTDKSPLPPLPGHHDVLRKPTPTFEIGWPARTALCSSRESTL